MAGTPGAVTDRLDPAKLHFVDANGIRTRYYEDGAGEPLVLIHGGQFGSQYSLDSWSLVLPAFAKHFHVFALDKLGQGHTDNPPGDDFSFGALSEHTRAVLQALGIRGAHLVGHSRGGLLITRLAQADPDLARSLVIVDSNTLAPEAPDFPSGAFYADLAKRTPPGPPTRETVRMEPDAQSYSRQHVTDDFVDRLLAIAQLPQRQEADARMKTLANTTWYPTLNQARDAALEQIDAAGLPAPGLLIWGMNDVSAPLRVHGVPLFERIAAKTPRAEMHVINETGHYVMREQPAAFVRSVRGFCLG